MAWWQIRGSPFLERLVPVTAKLSRKLYDKLGEDVATELVNWFNAVDATYRADLRELNEGKLEQRLAESDTKWERRLAELDTKWERRIADVRVEIQKARSDLVKWMFMFWAPTAFAVLGTGVGVVTLLLRS